MVDFLGVGCSWYYVGDYLCVVWFDLVDVCVLDDG